jgi:hypothetical protein
VFFQFFCTTLAGTGMLIMASQWNTTAVVFATGLIFSSFYLQSAWTQGQKFAPWLEWLKLGLVFVILGFLPLSPGFEYTLQIYLAISVATLAWLNAQPLLRATAS